MYLVYRLRFGEREYIGCTDDIRRRKNHHNENARKLKSKLGKYLSEQKIVLTESDFEIIGSFDHREDAMDFERKTAIDLSAKGVNLLNDNYAADCTRKGKNHGHCTKDYILIDYINHTVTAVNNLRQYCIQNGLSYSVVERTAKRNSYCELGVKAFLADDWEKEQNKEKYLSGEFVNDIKRSARESHVDKTSKKYIVRFPDGHEEAVKNLDKFAREHNLTGGTLHATITKNKPTKGYQVLRRI